MGDAASIRERLEAAYRATLAEELAAPGTRPPPAGWPPLRLPPALRETLVGAALLSGGACPPPLEDYYTRRMPGLLVDQLLRARGPAAELIWRPIDLARTPRLAGALQGLCRELAREGLPARGLLGADTPAELVALRPSAAALAAPTLFGGGTPLLGAYPAEREVVERDLAAGADADATLDLRMSGNLVHELCHGLKRELDGPPPPWMVIEAAAIHLGHAAFPRHIFPEEPAEAVPGISLFLLLGQGLARLFGRGALWRISLGASLADALGERAAGPLEAAGWQDWLARPTLPFAADALQAVAWIKLADACRGPSPPARDAPSLLAEAERVPWPALPWWGEEPGAADDALVEDAVRALFQINRLAPNFQTHPDEVPGGRLRLDVEACRLQAAPRPDGAFAEPAHWIFPPPLARRLHERGAHAVVVENALRTEVPAIAARLLELTRGTAPLAGEVVL